MIVVIVILGYILIQEAIRAGEISVDEIVDAFREDFERGAKP